MKKILLVLLLFIIIPNNIKATCDYKKEVEMSSYASKITYEKEYNPKLNKFNVTIYNLIPELYLTYNGEKYKGDKNNQLVIKNISEGEFMQLPVYAATSSCYTSLITVFITIPYYNDYYGSEKCEEYVDYLTVCSDQFINYEVTEDIINAAIKNYQDKIINVPKEKDPKATNLIDYLKNIITLWGLKVGLSVVTITIVILVFHGKYKKIKDGF